MRPLSVSIATLLPAVSTRSHACSDCIRARTKCTTARARERRPSPTCYSSPPAVRALASGCTALSRTHRLLVSATSFRTGCPHAACARAACCAPRAAWLPRLDGRNESAHSRVGSLEERVSERRGEARGNGAGQGSRRCRGLDGRSSWRRRGGGGGRCSTTTGVRGGGVCGGGGDDITRRKARGARRRRG